MVGKFPGHSFLRAHTEWLPGGVKTVFHVHMTMFHNAEFLLATYNDVAVNLALHWPRVYTG